MMAGSGSKAAAGGPVKKVHWSGGKAPENASKRMFEAWPMIQTDA